MQRLDTPSDKNIEKLLERAEKLAESDSVHPTSINRIQESIDRIDDQIEEPNFKLYETQAILYLILDDIENSMNYIEDALVLNDNLNDYTKHGKRLAKKYYELSEQVNEEESVSETYQPIDYDESNIVDNSTHQSMKEYSGKIQGWLKLYAIRLILLPLVLFYDLYTSFILEKDVEFDEAVMRYIAFVGFVEFGILLVSIWMIYYFFTKNRRATDIKYLEATLCVFQFIAGFWLYDLAQNYNVAIGPEVGRLFMYSFIALLWTVYWVRSKRVKETFVKE